MIVDEVRLIVWDLDETFWKGTLTEGGVTEFVQAHHDLVITLAHRGILSSICSKNDFDAVKEILTEQGLWTYFVFPSIDWTPKGQRLKALIDAAQLRPQNVLFIDDNPGNRAEASALIPGLQVVSETEISGLLQNPFLAGKPDESLTRLNQYKLLELKHAEAQANGGDNLAFLRGSDIRVRFIYDIEPHIDRAVELINRTNQLNFTKKRLSNDPEQARQELRGLIKEFWAQAGLVQVSDKYGDYGLVGFFLRGNGQGGGPGSLLHYCFSCRTLGMHVETWVYDQIGRPEIAVAQPVISDLFASGEIDWIRLAGDGEEATVAQDLMPHMLLRGGCEVDALSPYFGMWSKSCTRETSLVRGPFFVRKDVTSHLLIPESVCDNSAWRDFVDMLGFGPEDFSSELPSGLEPGSIVIYVGWGDLLRERFRHRATGQELVVCMPGFYGDLTALSDEDFARIAKEKKMTGQDQMKVKRALVTLARESEHVGLLSSDRIMADMAAFFDRLPQGCLCFALEADEIWVAADCTGAPVPERKAYNQCLREAAARQRAKGRAIQLVDLQACIASPSDRHADYHYDRIVYYRLAERIRAQVLQIRGA